MLNLIAAHARLFAVLPGTSRGKLPGQLNADSLPDTLRALARFVLQQACKLQELLGLPFHR